MSYVTVTCIEVLLEKVWHRAVATPIVKAEQCSGPDSLTNKSATPIIWKGENYHNGLAYQAGRARACKPHPACMQRVVSSSFTSLSGHNRPFPRINLSIELFAWIHYV
jgi:hypothetical protein